MSGGQSCTSVPMIYFGAITWQPKAYAASLQYLDPDGIRRQISEIIRDYTTYAFETDPESEEDEKISAKKVYLNAEAMLRTMFSDLPEFKNKAVIKKILQRHRSADQSTPQGSSLLSDLVQVCQERLKETATLNYREQFSADSAADLKAAIDPYLTTPSGFKTPVFWPLIRHVR